MSALGQPVALTFTVVNAEGAGVDPDSVTLTITLPDGSDVVKAIGDLEHTAPGEYRFDYLPTLIGLHAVQWTAVGTGSTTAPAVDSFHVDRALAPLISLAEARLHIGNPAEVATDQELAVVLAVASGLAELVTGKAWRRTPVTESLHPDNGRLWLSSRPVVEVTSVAGNEPRDSDVLGKVGVIRYGGGLDPVEVTYTAGPPDGVVPEHIREGVREMCRYLWPTRGQGTGRSRVPASEGQSVAGYLVPYRVLELWARDVFVPGGIG